MVCNGDLFLNTENFDQFRGPLNFTNYNETGLTYRKLYGKHFSHLGLTIPEIFKLEDSVWPEFRDFGVLTSQESING